LLDIQTALKNYKHFFGTKSKILCLLIKHFILLTSSMNYKIDYDKDNFCSLIFNTIIIKNSIQKKFFLKYQKLFKKLTLYSSNL